MGVCVVLIHYLNLIFSIVITYLKCINMYLAQPKFKFGSFLQGVEAHVIDGLFG